MQPSPVRYDEQASRQSDGVPEHGERADAAVLASDVPVNAMTVDVEEHFQVSAFEEQVQRSDWDGHVSRVERNVNTALGLFADAEAKATFFALGCVAEKHPQIIRAIVAAGHEIASHGYDHARVRNQTEDQFREDVSRTKALLEDISGEAVTGYRAPSFSIGPETPWAHDVLLETGHEYSSSVYPIRHDHYGDPGAPRFPYPVADGGLLEIPMTTARAFGRNLPSAGGGYFRLLPAAYSHWALKRVNSKERMPAVFYMHPWELDPEQPRIAGVSMKAKLRHYLNLGRFEGRLKKLLRMYEWSRMDDVYAALLPRR